MKSLIQLLHNINNEYLGAGIGEPPLYPDALLEKWLREALSAGCAEPSAMHVSTIGVDGFPECRTVLFKGFQMQEPDMESDEVKFLTFYTNYNSDKGKALALNNNIALTFFWPELFKEVRVVGRAYRYTTEAGESYWNHRPWKNKLASIISEQSRPIESRATLIQKFKEADTDLYGAYVTRPKNWGGYLVEPISYEFWQGRQNRLHERIKYTVDPNNDKLWHTQILQP